MRCCCDNVGPKLMKCPRCGMNIAPRGRSVGDAAAGGYCGCDDALWNQADHTELLAFVKATQKRSGLWPGERWGDSLPCIGDVKCEPKREEGEP
jgi:hypothetical protein